MEPEKLRNFEPLDLSFLNEGDFREEPVSLLATFLQEELAGGEKCLDCVRQLLVDQYPWVSVLHSGRVRIRLGDWVLDLEGDARLREVQYGMFPRMELDDVVVLVADIELCVAHESVSTVAGRLEVDLGVP